MQKRLKDAVGRVERQRTCSSEAKHGQFEFLITLIFYGDNSGMAMAAKSRLWRLGIGLISRACISEDTILFLPHPLTHGIK